MDREAIERRDFPVGRRGYDQQAVDAHLRRVADEVDALRSRAPLAAGTSEQVRVILEAAELSAAELREDAGRRAREHVERVEEAVSGMLGRLDEVEGELGTMLGALREQGRRLGGDLERLRQEVGENAPAEPFTPAVPAEPVPAEPVPAEPVADPGEPPMLEEDFAGAEAANGEPESDEAGARLIALNMALSGTPREETAAYLAEHFSLRDADALLDDVYARAGR